MGVILQKTEAQRGKVPRPRSCGGFAGKLGLRHPIPGFAPSHLLSDGLRPRGSQEPPDEAVVVWVKVLAPSLQAPQGGRGRL